MAKNFVSQHRLPVDAARVGAQKAAMSRRILIETMVMVMAGAVLGLIGPFGTFAIPTALRIILWLAMVLIGYAFFRGLAVATRWLSEATQMPRWAAIMTSLLLGAMPLTLVVAMLLTGDSLWEIVQSSDLGPLYLRVVLISAVLQMLMWLVFRDAQGADTVEELSVPQAISSLLTPVRPSEQPSPPPPTPEPVSADPVKQLLEQEPPFPLPAGFGQVIALKGEDHYVRVYGDGGQEELSLMRLRDAIDRVKSSEGLQVHRSWWVTREGTAHIARDGRAATITLATGQQVPVSRDMVPQLQDAGWL